MSIISVIVPVYKAEKYIHRCVDSILAQTFQDYELILVDDGSPDNCPKVCDEYAAKDPRVVVIHKENGGVSSARNLGLDIAKGEYITFIDSDDWIHPQMLEFLMKALLDHNAKISVCGYKSLSASESLSLHAEPSVDFWTPEDLYISRNVNAIVPWAKLFHKSLFESIRYPLGVRYEDERTIYKALFQVQQIPYIDSPLYFYFSNPTGFMNSRNHGAQMDIIPAFEEPLQFFSEHGYSNAFHNRIITYHQWLTTTIRAISLRSPAGLSTKMYLRKKRGQVFRRMNAAQKIRALNELYPRTMDLYWRIRAGVCMIFRGEWRTLLRRIKHKIYK